MVNQNEEIFVAIWNKYAFKSLIRRLQIALVPLAPAILLMVEKLLVFISTNSTRNLVIACINGLQTLFCFLDISA